MIEFEVFFHNFPSRFCLLKEHVMFYFYFYEV